MKINFFDGFKKFNEANPDTDKNGKPTKAPGYLNTVKKVMRVPKKLFFGMPFVVGANKKISLEGRTFKGPMAFYVTDYDEATVTLKLVRNPMDFSNEDDPDDEIDLDKSNPGSGSEEFTLPRAVFEKLLEPDNVQGVDFASASQTAMAPR